MLVWEESYRIGHDRMGSQHLVLVALINQLDINVHDDDAHDVLPDALKAVGAYVGYHFAEEEQVMRAAGYPRLDGHVAMRRDFAAEFERLLALAADGQALRAPYDRGYLPSGHQPDRQPMVVPFAQGAFRPGGFQGGGP